MPSCRQVALAASSAELGHTKCFGALPVLAEAYRLKCINCGVDEEPLLPVKGAHLSVLLGCSTPWPAKSQAWIASSPHRLGCCSLRGFLHQSRKQRKPALQGGSDRAAKLQLCPPWHRRTPASTHDRTSLVERRGEDGELSVPTCQLAHSCAAWLEAAGARLPLRHARPALLNPAIKKTSRLHRAACPLRATYIALPSALRVRQAQQQAQIPARPWSPCPSLRLELQPAVQQSELRSEGTASQLGVYWAWGQARLDQRNCRQRACHRPLPCPRQPRCPRAASIKGLMVPDGAR